jgi:DNA mismatch repair protein MutL
VPRIQLLSETLANQIAAGEVVERPAAVVKELVENALDAGARLIEVSLADGGRTLIRVRDDGSGMGREDAALSLQRHATSKLRSKEDLFAISTYGFRGEALPSIAAVSRFTLLTCEASALAGTRIEVDGGRTVSVEDAGAPAGTTIEVRDLFWNVPARKKFLKRAQSEQAQSVEALLRLALPRPDVSFTITEGARTLARLQTGPDQVTLHARAEEALGREVRGNLMPFDASVRGVRAHGLAASPAIEHSNARGVWLFVNGRAVRDRALTHAVLRAYGEVMPHGRYPAAIVFLEVPPDEVDVNVHPAKSEVRLADGRAGWEAISAALAPVLARGDWLHMGLGTQAVAATRDYSLTPGQTRVAEALSRYGAQPMSDPSAIWQSGRSAPVAEEAWSSRAGAGAAGRGTDGAAAQAGVQPSLIGPAPFFGGLRYLGQLHRSYLVCEGPRGLVLIDQHAAHERMNYQRLRARPGTEPVQPLLVPLLVELTQGAAALAGESAAALGRIGIELEHFGGTSVAIKALPPPLARLDERQLPALLVDLLDELSAQGRDDSLGRLTDALLARAACHASVRAHDLLAPGEAQALLDSLDATDYGARCAHGRPVVSEWGIAEIEKRFGRNYESHAHAAPPELA